MGLISNGGAMRTRRPPPDAFALAGMESAI
jgi:hypothetical protein